MMFFHPTDKKRSSQVKLSVLSLLLIFYAFFFLMPVVSHAENGTLEQKWYEVQMVIFLNKNLSSKEHWPDHQQEARIPPGAIKLKTADQIKANAEAQASASAQIIDSNTTSMTGNNTASMNTSTNPLQPDLQNNLMVWLPPNGSFTGVISSLQKSGHYPVLYTARWRMPLIAYGKPVTIVINAAQNTFGTPMLSGTITFDQKRFYYVQPDLTYGKSPGNNQVPGYDIDSKKNIRYFPLSQHQRIKALKKLTYIDNPVIGILVKLSPYKIPVTPVSDVENSLPEPVQKAKTDNTLTQTDLKP